MKKLIALASLFAVCAATAAAQQAAPPKALTRKDVLATKIAEERAGGLVADDILYLYLAERAAAATNGTDAAHAFVNAANATRTDMQVGAPSNAPGATSLVEKPGAADLLQVAIENGTVSQTKSGTSVTLATTPYLIAGFFGVRDDPDAWRDYATLRHFAISATFNNDAEVAEGNFTSIQSGEVKWTILGNRSPRDAALAANLQPELVKRVAPQLLDTIRLCTDVSGLTMFDKTSGDFETWFQAQNPRPTDADVAAKLDELLAGAAVDASHQRSIDACADAIVLKAVANNQFVQTMSAMTAVYVARNQEHQLSLAGSSHRDATIDDFATFKILYGRNTTVPKLSINFNGEANFNQHHNAKNLHQIRSFAFEGGATMGRFNEGRFDATFSGKLWRNNDTKNKNVSVFQLKGNIHVAQSLVLPVSVSYATEAADTIKKGFQLNFGFASLLDSFLGKAMAATP